jgi:PAS domain S-box-containing protein
MTHPIPRAASLPDAAPSGQGLVAQHVFQAAVHKTRMAMAFADPNLPDAPLAYVNPSFEAMTGYTAEEVIGRNCRFLQGPETDPETVDRIRQRLAARQEVNEELYNYRKDGSGFWNALFISPVYDGDGALIYFFASQIDISAEREAARRQLQRMESMGALASGVAHEFNNLMTVVLSSVERAASRATDEWQKLLLDRAGWASRRAGRLATELLSLARRPTGQDQSADLNEIVVGLKQALAEVAGDAIRLRLELAPEPVMARLEQDQLKLVLTNLVRNAADSLNGAGEIVLSTRLLSAAQAASALNGKAAVELSVSDTGAGMPPEVRTRATELFFTTKKAGEGTGLGLFLSLEFVDRAAGKLVIDSELGHGTTVRMIFPEDGAR